MKTRTFENGIKHWITLMKMAGVEWKNLRRWKGNAIAEIDKEPGGCDTTISNDSSI